MRAILLGTVRVSINTTGLAVGTYTGSVVVTSSSASNSPKTIPVTLTISPPALTVSPNSLVFTYIQGGTIPTPQMLSVGSTGAALSFTVNTSGGTWLTATGSGNTPGSVSVSVNTTSLSGGTYSGSAVVSSPTASNTPQTIPVTLTVSRTQLTVIKVLQPGGDPGLFNLQIDGVTKAVNVGNGGSTGPQVMSVGSHTVGETAGTGTNLTAYAISINCGAGLISATSATVNLALGDNKTCTITNLVPPWLTVNKIVLPAGDSGLFNLQIDGATKAVNVGNAGTTGPQVLSVGSHTVSETGGTGTNLSNYTTVISGDCAPDGTVSIAQGEEKICTITNKSKKPSPPANLTAKPAAYK